MQHKVQTIISQSNQSINLSINQNQINQSNKQINQTNQSPHDSIDRTPRATTRTTTRTTRRPPPESPHRRRARGPIDARGTVERRARRRGPSIPSCRARHGSTRPGRSLAFRGSSLRGTDDRSSLVDHPIRPEGYWMCVLSKMTLSKWTVLI